jgi:nickel-dependent lactate racemase
MDDLISISLNYGRSGRFSGQVLRKRMLLYHRAALNVRQEQREIRAALANPIDFPDLRRTFVPGDRVVIVLDLGTPAVQTVLAELWPVLEEAGVSAEAVTLLQPATWQSEESPDPRGLLPPDVQKLMTVKRHDPTLMESCTYLASTASGDRIYLSRELVDADVAVCIGPAEYDPVLGYRGTCSSLYPGLSDVEAIRKTFGLGHDELEPDDPRPLRQTADEIGWLLGIQLAITVIPGVSGGVQNVLVGQSESVMGQARTRLQENWRVELEERAELVLVSVDEDASGHGWPQLAAALETARRLVEREGRIVVLTELDMPATFPGDGSQAPPPPRAAISPGLELLRNARTPREALQPIRRQMTPDMIVATQIARAVDWANVSLLSRLDPNLVEDLFMVPLESEEEVRRLLSGDETTAIIESAQHTFGICRSFEKP